jgi:hypothetical protein
MRNWHGNLSPFGSWHTGRRVFNPLSLFANGEQGVWFDPSDLTTTFTDTAGTTPAQVGQAVALMLDKSKGLALGPELVTNGTFDSGTTGWTLGAGWTISGGAATKTLDVTSQISQNIGAGPAGTSYEITLTVTRLTGAWLLRLGAPSVNLVASSSSGTFKAIYVSQGSDQTFRFLGDASFTGSVSNISVRELPGNHATQSITTARPILARVPASGRRNLLTRTEEFDNAVWSKTTTTATANADIAPDGSVTADRLLNAGGSPVQAPTIATAIVQDLTFSVWLRSATGSNQSIPLSISGAGSTTVTVTPVWQRFSATWVNASVGNWNGRIGATGSYDVYAWGAQLEVGSTATAYQKVVSTYDVTEAGKADNFYLSFDGIDDSMSTPSIDFTGTDKMTVFAGVRKLSDAGSGAIVNHNGTGLVPHFALFAPVGTAANFSAVSCGATTQRAATATGIAAPATRVFSGLFDLTAPSIVNRQNGVVAATNTQDQGGGNFATSVLRIGAVVTSGSLFNGQIYSLIVRGAQTDLALIQSTERYVAGKTGVVLP